MTTASRQRSPSHNACEQIIGWQAAAGLGDQPAILAGSCSVSYAELTAMTNAVGNALLSHGIKPDDRILLLTKDSPEMVAAYMAVMKIGAIAVALNTRSSAREIGHAMADSQCSAFILDPEFRPLFQSGSDISEYLPPLVIDDVAEFSAGASTELEACPVLPTDKAFLIYTSGTTGAAKAAIHRHGDVSIGDLHLRVNFNVRPGDRVFSTSKLFFAFALGHSMIGALKCGATIILHDGWPDADGVAAVVEQHSPTILLSVPTLYRNLLRSRVTGLPAFKGIRHFISAGERLPDSVFMEWLEETKRPILEGIGTSEIVFLAIANTPSAYRKGSSGRPQPWATVKLIGEDGQPVRKPDQTGVLWLKMASVAAGYWNRADKTAEAFQKGWYCTGDIFSFDADGWWEHHGRGDDMLKISGQWVSPAEIEEHALKVPGIIEAAAVGVTNEDGLVRLGLAVVSADHAPGQDILEESLRQHFERNLSIYKCPRRIRFVEAMPRTVTGKLQRFRVRDFFAQ
ncbi:3-hydroxybenzoate--CoA/4-hydroxybenzoate--CoA ligase [Candidatus Terasakiella magnetica]|nr:3-hydroxybenzoate--CoA/4-hydroxybenzoate--CoA ligase [Candidatus Terasakiella magnetica]